MQQIIWTARTFNFDFPATMFPVIISRLAGAYPRIKYLQENVNSELLIYQPNGKWSVQQHIGHLIDLEELHTSRIDDYRNNKPVLSAWDGLNIKTEQAHHNSKNREILLHEFKKVREEFISELLKFSDDELMKTSLHPRLQKQMRIVDMAFFVAEHDDHHITKMETILHQNEN